MVRSYLKMGYVFVQTGLSGRMRRYLKIYEKLGASTLLSFSAFPLRKMKWGKDTIEDIFSKMPDWSNAL